MVGTTYNFRVVFITPIWLSCAENPGKENYTHSVRQQALRTKSSTVLWRVFVSFSRRFIKGRFLKNKFLFLQKLSYINENLHRTTAEDYFFICLHYSISKPYFALEINIQGYSESLQLFIVKHYKVANSLNLPKRVSKSWSVHGTYCSFNLKQMGRKQ